mmetsp:Transcript_3685/g.10748  ORF Transcript_3685/g.10748 Transcript_3685/m.10748 type:complete len:262 (-) Transcript_3685:914-1699(-)
MEAVQPKSCLEQRAAGLERLPELALAIILCAAGDHESHRRGLLPNGGELVVAHERLLGHGVVADHGKLLALPELVVMEEQWVRQQCRHVHLGVQLDPQALWQCLERFNVILVHAAPLPIDVLPDKAEHPIAQLQLHPMVGDVLPRQLLLPMLRLVDAPEMCHGRGDAADERRGAQESHDDHADGERPLHRVLWDHLHGRRHELRKRPMQGSQVRVEVVHVHPCVYAQLLDPRPVIYLQSAHQVPSARDAMVQRGCGQNEFR